MSLFDKIGSFVSDALDEVSYYLDKAFETISRASIFFEKPEPIPSHHIVYDTAEWFEYFDDDIYLDDWLAWLKEIDSP